MNESTRIYLDYNAGAPLRPEAREAMVAALGGGNPSSVHAEGRAARATVEKARAAVAALVGAEAANVVFTSGGSESNAAVLAPWVRIGGSDRRIDRLLVGATEHPSVLAGGRFPPDPITTVPVDRDGVIDLEALARLLDEAARAGEAVMISVMLANNETGAIQPVREIVALAAEHDALVHTDAAQAAGRIPVDIEALGADFLTLSGHKLGGPQGTGAIVRRSEDVAFVPLVTGGGQEHRRRAGTENVAGIAGFAAAAEATAADLARAAEWAGWRDRLADALSRTRKATVFSGRVARLPQTLCFGVEGLSAETLVIGLDLEGVAVSSGSACSSGKVGPSHVLAATATPAGLAKSAIRLSYGWDTKEKDLDIFQSAFDNVIGRMAAAKGHKAA